MRPSKTKPAVGAQLAVSRRLQDIFLHNPLPSHEESEKAILSCFLHDPELLDQPLNPDVFYHPSYKLIYQEMKAMRQSSTPVQYILLGKWLTDRGLMQQAGGQGMLAELLDFVPTPSHFKYYLDILVGCHLARATVAGGQAVIEVGYHHDHKEIASVASAQLALIEQAARGVHKEPSMEDHLEKWQEDWNEMAIGKKRSAMPTRWKSWNKKITGIRSGYTVIMGPRASGKSVLAQNIITDCSLSFSRPSLFVSYEMPVRMILNRIISDLGSINGAYLFSPDLCPPTPEITRKIGSCIDRIRASQLRIVHDVTMGVEGIVARVKQIYAKHGDCVVAVDYLGLMKPPKTGKFDTKEQVIGGNSGILRDLSKELDIPVFALSQVNKDGTTRDSNAPEQDADDLYRIDRFKMPDGSIKDEGVICMKNRNGEDGPIGLVLNGPLFRFEESSKLMP